MVLLLSFRNKLEGRGIIRHVSLDAQGIVLKDSLILSKVRWSALLLFLHTRLFLVSLVCIEIYHLWRPTNGFAELPPRMVGRHTGRGLLSSLLLFDLSLLTLASFILVSKSLLKAFDIFLNLLVG